MTQPPDPEPSTQGKKGEKKKRKPLFILLDVVIVLVAATGLYLVLSPLYNHWQQDRATASLDEAFAVGDGTIEISPDDFPVEGEDVEYVYLEDEAQDEDPDAASEPEELTIDSVTIEAIGTIQIEAIDLKMPVASQSRLYDLRVAIGHYSPSPGFGKDGLTVLFGHRMYTRGRHFNRLDEVTGGDTVVLEDRTTRYTYTIEEKVIVEPQEMLEQLRHLEGDDPRLMLVTCHPVRVASHRLLVYANLTDTQPLDEG